MACRIDQQPNHWFKCAHGTIGCPIIHDGVEPHCINCSEGVACPYHTRLVKEIVE